MKGHANRRDFLALSSTTAVLGTLSSIGITPAAAQDKKTLTIAWDTDIDSLDPARFRTITRGGDLAAVTAGIAAAHAAGFELDSVNPKYGTPPHALVVAKGIVIHPDYLPVNEDMLVHRHPLAQEDWSCADMTFFETPKNGAVFSTGSITFCGSLPSNNFDNNCSKLLSNVLDRFLDPEARFPLPKNGGSS